jgi:hypothetical protein
MPGAGEASAAQSVYRLRPGRDLRFAPEWAGSKAQVVFDAASGDYWVVTRLAASVLRGLAAGPRPLESLMALDGAERLRSTAYLREVLDGLIDADLLVA